jgi:hypothetical protein
MLVRKMISILIAGAALSVVNGCADSEDGGAPPPPPVDECQQPGSEMFMWCSNYQPTPIYGSGGW